MNHIALIVAIISTFIFITSVAYLHYGLWKTLKYQQQLNGIVLSHWFWLVFIAYTMILVFIGFLAYIPYYLFYYEYFVRGLSFGDSILWTIITGINGAAFAYYVYRLLGWMKEYEDISAKVAAAALPFELVEDYSGSRTLDEATARWEKQGCEIATLRHFYALADCLTQEQIESIRQDCRASWLFCGRLCYQGGKSVSFDGREFVECPEYYLVPLEDVISTPEGLKLIQVLCGTEDDAKAILKKFVKLSGMSRDHIRVWTVGLTRKEFSSMTAWLGYGDNGFFMGFSINSIGRFRGVRVREVR